jgi:hypothetical protein
MLLKDNRSATDDRPEEPKVAGFVCRMCLEMDGILSSAVVERRCTNDRMGKQFKAYVCARCLDIGRETRVTCRTFVLAHVD